MMMQSQWIEPKWSDPVWVGCIVAAQLLFFLRKVILARHGHRFDLFDMEVKDGQRLRKIAEKEEKTKVKLFYNSINWGFRLLFTLGLSMLAVTRIIR